MAKLIYVADDEKDILEVVNVFLTNAGYQVKTFSTGDSLLAAFRRKAADLVVLDLMMPGMEGFTVCNELRKFTEVPIVILSAKGSEFDRIKGLTIGSDDYLVKPFSPTELVARIHSIFRRIAYSRGEEEALQLQYGNVVIDSKTHKVYMNAASVHVTPMEYDFLVYMINRPEKSVSREDLLRDVWHVDTAVGGRIVDDLVKRVRRKMNDAGTDIYLETVWGYGFKITMYS